MACDRSSISLTLVHLFHRYAIEGKALAGIWLIGATGCKGLVSLYAGRTVIRFDRKYCRRLIFRERVPSKESYPPREYIKIQRHVVSATQI